MPNDTDGPAHRPPATCRTCGQVHRRKLMRPSVAALICAVVTIVALAAFASGLPDYWRNFALNTAADLLGAAIFLHVIGPIAQRRQVEHDADHDAVPRTSPHPEPNCHNTNRTRRTRHLSRRLATAVRSRSSTSPIPRTRGQSAH